MASLDITIIDATGSMTQEATVPGDAAAARIIAKLLEQLQWPMTGPDGVALSYRFHLKRTGQEIGDNDTLDSAGVKNGDTLRLLPEVTAG